MISFPVLSPAPAEEGIPEFDEFPPDEDNRDEDDEGFDRFLCC